MLRAYDKATGKEAGAVYMPAGQTGTPMTYMLNGSSTSCWRSAAPGTRPSLSAVPAVLTD